MQVYPTQHSIVCIVLQHCQGNYADNFTRIHGARICSYAGHRSILISIPRIYRRDQLHPSSALLRGVFVRGDKNRKATRSARTNVEYQVRRINAPDKQADINSR